MRFNHPLRNRHYQLDFLLRAIFAVIADSLPLMLRVPESLVVRARN